MGFDCEPECLDLLPGHQFVLFSDGLNEARNLHGEMLGVEGVEAMFAGQGASLMERLVGGWASIWVVTKPMTMSRLP